MTRYREGGGRPARSPLLAMFENGFALDTTWTGAIEAMMVTNRGFSVDCPVEKRRSVRASITTTARRQGVKVTTRWANGRLWVSEVRDG